MQYGCVYSRACNEHRCNYVSRGTDGPQKLRRVEGLKEEKEKKKRKEERDEKEEAEIERKKEKKEET